MRIVPADSYPGAEHHPLEYPGRRPEFSYVYYKGQVYEITPKGPTFENLVLETPSGQITLDSFLDDRGNAPLDKRHAVLAVGSNGCPGRLAEKFGRTSQTAIPVLTGTITDTAVVYSRNLVSYGALPATYLYQPGALSWLSVTLLSKEQLERMDETENIGTLYQRIFSPGVFKVKNGPEIGNLTAYLDRKILTYKGTPVLVKMFARKRSRWPVMDERAVLSLVFDEAQLLRGQSIQRRHRKLLDDHTLRQQLVEFLEMSMGGLTLDLNGRIVRD